MATVVGDSYSNVKEDIELQETDSNIWSDFYWSTINSFRAISHGWPTQLEKKLQNQLVTRAVTVFHLMNGLDVSLKTAKSIVDAYFPHESIRYNRQDSCPLDGMLIARAASTLGFGRTYYLLKNGTKTENQIDGMASDIANIAAKQESLQQVLEKVLEQLKSASAAKDSLV